MSDRVIKVENVSKIYHIGRANYKKTFREAIIDAAKAPFSALHKNKSDDNTIWALKNVSFDVQKGDVLGIIGKNGAGKSTLLKILSKITEPSSGRIEMTGRVGSLLEVGTGFHAELTGHENIYLYGAILGMDRFEVTRKFDEIVAFAEIDKFINTPVKHYSSGMYMRLAFAVAAHLEPEILLVDEVLAVGDAQFQKKCLGKMDNVAKAGRTVLFVSHNMSAIKYLCNTGIVLLNGAIVFSGPVDDAVEKYESSFIPIDTGASNMPGVIYQNNAISPTGYDVCKVSLSDEAGKALTKLSTMDNFRVEIEFNSPDDSNNRTAILIIMKSNNEVMLRCGTRPYSSTEVNLKKGFNRVRCHIKNIPLPAGNYLLSFGITDSLTGQWLFDKEIARLEIEPKDIYNCGSPPIERHAAAVTPYEWEIMP